MLAIGINRGKVSPGINQFSGVNMNFEENKTVLKSHFSCSMSSILGFWVVFVGVSRVFLSPSSRQYDFIFFSSSQGLLGVLGPVLLFCHRLHFSFSQKLLATNNMYSSLVFFLLTLLAVLVCRAQVQEDAEDQQKWIDPHDMLNYVPGETEKPPKLKPEPVSLYMFVFAQGVFSFPLIYLGSVVDNCNFV